MNFLYAEIGHPLEVITNATGRAMGLHLTGTFEPFEDCALGNVKKSVISKRGC